MALSTRTYQELEDLVLARAGATISDNSKARVKALANSAANIAYRSSPYWTRFLVLEPRSLVRGYVDYTEDSCNVYGAGTGTVNGLYVRNGTTFSQPKYTKYDSDGTTVLYDLQAGNGSGTQWEIVDADSTVVYSYNSTATATPPETGWTGSDVAPIVQLLGTIDEVHGIWDGAKWQGANPQDVGFYPDQNGIRVTCTDNETVYVAYKKDFTDTYGDGTGGSTNLIPSEWFEFMAYHAAFSYQRAEMVQVDTLTIAQRDVQARLDEELLKLSRQGIWRTIANTTRNYYNFDRSVR